MFLCIGIFQITSYFFENERLNIIWNKSLPIIKIYRLITNYLWNASSFRIEKLALKSYEAQQHIQHQSAQPMSPPLPVDINITTLRAR